MAYRVMQLNCQGSFPVMCDLGARLCDRDISIALVQEPYTTNGCIRGLPASLRIFLDTRCNAAVIVNDAEVESILVCADDFGVCVSIEGQLGIVWFVSVYCKFGEPLDPYLRFLDTVLLQASSTPVFIGMDGNASSTMWFSKMSRHSSGYQNHYRGEVLSEWCLSQGLNVLNEESEWFTFDGPRGCSDIDITLVNQAASRCLEFDWKVLGGTGLSDHNPIEVVITHAYSEIETDVIKTWRTGRADWVLYGECIQFAFRGLPLDAFTRLEVDEMVRVINEKVDSVNEDLFERSRKTKPRQVRWWNRELNEKRRMLRLLRRKFQRARTTAAADVDRLRYQFRRSDKEYKEMMVRHKENEWRAFVHDHRDDPWGHVYKIMRGRRKQFQVNSLQVGEQKFTTWSGCVRVLLNEFFPRADDHIPSVGNGSVHPLEDAEVDYAFSRVRSRRSPGLDGMTGEMCKSIWKAVPEHLGALYNKCVCEGYFPTEWKKARVVVLLKSPNKVKSNPRSYRGISLLPVMGKVLERILVERLQERVEDTMSERQFGFKQGLGVEDAWNFVKVKVQSSVRKYVLGVFVDFKGAFDYLSWSKVLERLREVGCREITLWKSYFSNRKACVVGANGSEWIDVERGCPQGSICGPFIWNLMMDTLLRRLEMVSECCAYADDLLVIIEGQSRLELERKGAEVMQIICEWGECVGVSVAGDKSVTMLLKGKLSLTRPPVIAANGVSLKYVTEVKYLGVTMSERMCFIPHLAQLKERLVNTVGQVRRVLISEWGLSRRAVRIIYKGLLVACATFGASVWYGVVSTAVGLKRMQSCQRVMLLGCLPVCRTVSTDALQVLMGVPPLDLEVIRRAIAFRIKRGLELNEWIDEGSRAFNLRERKELLQECVISRWQNRWDRSENGRLTNRFIKNVRFVGDRPDFKFSLGLGYLLTGHGSLNAFLHKRGLSESSCCPCGVVCEDSLHVLFECRLYSDLRDPNMWGFRQDSGVYDLSLDSISENRMEELDRFACDVFKRRKALLG